jgi:hypothetical protein
MLAALVVRASKGVEGRKVHSEQSAQPQTLKEKTREGHQRSGVSSIGRGTSVLVCLLLGGAPAFWLLTSTGRGTCVLR